MFERIEKFIGKNNLNKINESHVAVIGLGGVGGYATEALIRSGVQHIIIVDYDIIDITNINRQIIANNSNIGKLKTEVMKEHITAINPHCQVDILNLKLDPTNLEKLFKYKFNYLIDCCDTIPVKQELIKKCLEKNITFISSMGTGNKLNPQELTITDITNTSYDPIARRIRKYLKDNKIKGPVPVIYSKEQNKKFTGNIPSLIFVPSVAGLMCAHYIIKKIIEKKDQDNSQPY